MKAAPAAPSPSVPLAILVHFPRCLDGPTVHPRDPREPAAEGVRQGREQAAASPQAGFIGGHRGGPEACREGLEVGGGVARPAWGGAAGG